MPLISVIVPVYKVEEYLPFCVDSILAQTFRDFELILVDDGSPDRCGAMCDEYAVKDSRVRVIHRENGGLSAARNSGMEIAGGDYIAFIDSDDAVTPDYLEKLRTAAEQTGAEIAVCGYEEFSDSNRIRWDMTQTMCRRMVFSGVEACLDLYGAGNHIPINAWGKLYRTELISGMRFPEGKLHEDQAYVPIALYTGRKTAVISEKLYLYRVRDGSIMQERFSVRRYDDIWALDQCIAFFEAHGEKEIAESAREKRKRTICKYAIYAKRDNIAVPEAYRVSTGSALRYLYGKVPDEKFEYLLAQLSRRGARCFEYYRKLKKLFRAK